MSVEETIQILHSIEDRAGDFPNMTDCDWVAIAAAKRHLSTLKANENLVYTKQELRDMGFGFDLNGNIETPEECYKRAEKYIECRKKKLIDKACEFIKDNLPNRIYDRDCYLDTFTELFIEDFRKNMED